MKKILLAITLMMTLTTGSWASKAIPTPLTFRQPDGSVITVTMHGDEHTSWYTTTDGVFVSRIGNSFYVSELRDGTLFATNIMAHNANERNAAELSAIARQETAAMYAALDKNTEESHRKNVTIAHGTTAYFPHSGSPKVLVILAEYSDHPFTLADPQKSFDQLFNAEGAHTNYGNSENRNYFSVREYFKVCSDGQFTPEFVVTGPVSVGEMGTYGGSNANNANDENVTQLTVDAITALGDKVDYNDFDNDGDGNVDLVYIIYSGYGQNSGGDANTVWAKTSSFNRVVGDNKFSWYTCAPELNLYPDYYKSKGIADPYINGIGVICHEFSHALGLPDVYPTSATAHVDNQEMEYWDLMDGGEYVYNGYRPKDYLAWEREAMGWKDIEALGEDTENIQIKPMLDGGKAYKFVNPENANEYFVLENIQAQGLNKSFPGHGLIVYHVNWTTSTIGMSSCPNNIKGKPGMAIVPADGACLSSYLDYTSAEYRESHGGDAFPGTSNVCELNYTQELPNYNWYNGEAKVMNALYGITEDEATGTVTFSYTSDYDEYMESAIILPTATQTGSQYFYDLQGRRTSSPAQGIYILNGKKFVK